VVDDRGRVVATVFAATTGGPAGGFAIPAEQIRDALAEPEQPTGTGPCTG
jgi:S1-C subfamily serine protease